MKKHLIHKQFITKDYKVLLFLNHIVSQSKKKNHNNLLKKVNKIRKLKSKHQHKRNNK